MCMYIILYMRMYRMRSACTDITYARIYIAITVKSGLL